MTPTGVARMAFRSPAFHLTLVLLLTAGTSAWWVDSIGGPGEVRARFGVAAPLASVCLHALLNVSPLPGDVVAIANGALYGVSLATGLNWLGWYLAAFVQFGIGRRAARDFDLAEQMGRLPAALRRFPIEHPAYLLIARLLPWAGGHLTTWIPGAAGVRVWRFAWCTAIAIVPASIGFAVVGAGAVQWLGR